MFMQVFKTGVDEFLMLCQMFTVLVLEHCPDVSVDVDASNLPSLDGPCQLAESKGNQHKTGKVAAATSKAKQKGKALPSKENPKKNTAKKAVYPPSKRQLGDMESIEAMRLGDTAKRGTSGALCTRHTQ